jgi:small subunit ribosomal protein S17
MPDENSAPAEAGALDSETAEVVEGNEQTEMAGPSAEAEAPEAATAVVEGVQVPETEAAVEVQDSDDVAAEPGPDGGVAEDAPSPSASSSAKPKKKRMPRSLRPQRTKTKREKPAERKPITRLPKPEHPRGRRQERQGRVVSASADKTIVVRVDVAKVHPRYKKVVKRSTRFHAHDEENRAKVGDVVRIVETRPISRMKRWRLQEIVEAAK